MAQAGAGVPAERKMPKSTGLSGRQWRSVGVTAEGGSGGSHGAVICWKTLPFHGGGTPGQNPGLPPQRGHLKEDRSF